MKTVSLILLVFLISCSPQKSENDILNNNYHEVDFAPFATIQEPVILGLLGSLNFSKLIDKHNVSDIPEFIFSFLEKTYSQKFSITDKSENFRKGCLIFPHQIRMDSIEEALTGKEKIYYGSKLIFFSQGINYSILAFHTAGWEMYPSVIIFEHSEKNVTDHWIGKFSGDVKNSKGLIKGLTMRKKLTMGLEKQLGFH